MKLVTIREGISSGIHPATKELEVPLWKSGRNVQFRQDRVEKISGWLRLASGIFNYSRGIHQVLHAPGIQRIYIRQGSNLLQWDAVNLSSITTGLLLRQDDSAVGPATAGSFANWGTQTVMVDDINVPYIIYPNSVVLGVPELIRARIVRKLGPHMIAFATQDGATTIQWCSGNDINDWDFLSTTNTAGKRTLYELDGPIQCVEPLGERLALYTADSMFLVTYIGGNFIFASRAALNGIGAVGARCVVSLGRKNYGYSKKGFFITDGSQFTYIDSPAVRNYVQGRINNAQLSKMCSYHDEASSQIRWFYPAGTNLECSEGVGYDYLRNSWTLFDFALSSADERDVFDWPIGMGSAGRLIALNSGLDADGLVLPADITTKRLDLGNANVWKFIDQLKLECAAEVTFRTYETLTGPATTTITTTLTGDFSPMEIQASGRFFDLTIASTVLGADWSLGSIDILGSFSGADA